MRSAVVWATFAASALFAACEHGTPAPREMAPMGPRPTQIEPAPLPAAEPAAFIKHARVAETQRDLHADDDLHLLPPAQRMPVTNVPAQPMPAGPHVDDEPSSVKPDGGMQWDGGAPLPPIPDGGPLPQTRDASLPL